MGVDVCKREIGKDVGKEYGKRTQSSSLDCVNFNVECR